MDERPGSAWRYVLARIVVHRSLSTAGAVLEATCMRRTIARPGKRAHTVASRADWQDDSVRDMWSWLDQGDDMEHARRHWAYIGGVLPWQTTLPFAANRIEVEDRRVQVARPTTIDE